MLSHMNKFLRRIYFYLTLYLPFSHNLTFYCILLLFFINFLYETIRVVVDHERFSLNLCSPRYSILLLLLLLCFNVLLTMILTGNGFPTLEVALGKEMLTSYSPILGWLPLLMIDIFNP